MRELFYSDKDICIRLRVSDENQERLKDKVSKSFAPLFALKRNQFFNIRFEYKTFTCTYQGKKQEYTYKDIEKIETITDGLIIYLNNDKYISVATERFEKHNTELYDAVLFLKRYNRRIFCKIEEISYPDEDCDGRYKSDKEPISQIVFELSDNEINRLLWYEYFGEKTLPLIVTVVLGMLTAIVMRDLWVAMPLVFLAIPILISTITFFGEKDGYIKNHRGMLYALIYDEVLVIRLNNADLELEYNTMKRLNNTMGLLRIKSGNFFVLTLPKRIENENPSFFDTLYQKIK